MKTGVVNGTSLLAVLLLCLLPGPAASQDTESLYRQACDDGDLVVCNIFGLMYESGESVPRDPARAAVLFQRACEGGLLAGCTNLGSMYESGTGVAQDLSRALGLYRMACEGQEMLACRSAERVVESGGGEPAVVDEPAEPGRVTGRVTDEGGKRGLSGVEVIILTQPRARTISRGGGRFNLTDLVPGMAEIRFARLGYAPRTAQFVVQAGRTVELSAALSTEPIELEAIEVTVRSRLLERNVFYRRMDGGFGRQLTQKDLEDIDPMYISDVVRRIPGVRVRYSNRGSTVAVSGRGAGFSGGGCVLAVYVDGIRVFDPDLDQFPREWIDAMEVYHGMQTPFEYSMLNSCGVILIWTNLGGR